MSHQLCQDCGSNQFEHIDGRLYCLICQSQNLAMQIHVSFANEGNEQLGRRVRDQTTTYHNETIPKIEIFEANETLPYTTDETITRINELTVEDHSPPSHIWGTYEVYSYILNLQIQSLIKLNIISKNKENDLIECSFMIYLRYLSAHGILDTNEQRLLIKQEEKRLKTNFLSKIDYTNRIETLEKLNTHITNKKLCTLNLDILIAIIHCACTLINSPLTIKQLIDLINQNQIPYYNIKTYLPSWMLATARDRFNLEKMTIHCANFVYFYNDHLQPVIKIYFEKYLFHSIDSFSNIFINVCKHFCMKIFFPFDYHTKKYFHSISKEIFQQKILGRQFLSTSYHLELSALIIVIIIILLRSIDEHLLDRFIKKNFSKQFFSYSLWLNHLNQLNYLQSIKTYQFHGRNSILVKSTTDSQSKIRYMNNLSKIFDRTTTNSIEHINKIGIELEKELIENCKEGSLIYAIQTQEFFVKEFQNLSSHHNHNRLSEFFEQIVNTYSPQDFSLIDKSELYEILISLVNGATIDQIENIYLIHQHFDYAVATNFHINHLLSTVTKFCSIPYNQEFYSFFSRFLKTFCFCQQNLHHYFYCSTFSKRFLNQNNSPKQYGIDHIPIIYDIKFEQ